MLDTVLCRPASIDCFASGDHSRRDFLRIGAVAGLSLPGVFPAVSTAASQVDHPSDRRLRRRRADAVILVFLGGGLSHLDSFDPKPEAPTDIRGRYRPIDTAVVGLHISEQLPQMAQVMGKVALLRSATHDSNHHETASNEVLSGRFGSPFGDYPALGAVVAHEVGCETGFAGLVPPYVAIPRNPSFTWELGKSAFLGCRYEAYPTGVPLRPHVPSPDELLAPSFHEALTLDHEPVTIRERFGQTSVGQSLLLARRLVERGVRFVTVNCPGWDHHSSIFDRLDKKLPELDQALSALIDDMDSRGILTKTLLVVMGEFGRTPKINPSGGRDHWSRAAALLFAGAGVRPGLVLGRTDKYGAFVTQRPVSPADVAYTILDSLGIDPRQRLPMPDGRPVEILDRGECIHELFE
jgi:hypothetical protein